MKPDLSIMQRYDSKYLEPAWNNQILNYDKDKYAFRPLFLNAIQEKFPEVKQIEDLHLHVAVNDMVPLRKHVENMMLGNEFITLVDTWLDEYVAPLLPSNDFMVQRTPGLRMMVPDQAKKGRLLSFHCGHWNGYNNGIYSVWTPITRTWGSNAMQVISWEDSIDIMKEIHSNRLTIDEVQELCIKHCWSTDIDVGQSWLFNQGIVHGNVNNDTGVTRMSFDTRVMIKDIDYGVRYPGGFFRLKNQKNNFNIPDTIDHNRKWVVFVDQASNYVGNTPQFVIREFLLPWCKKYNIKPIDWVHEYLHNDWNLNLHYFMTNGVTEGLVFASIHAFSAYPQRRLELMQLALDRGIQIAFVDENILLDSQESLEYIKKIYEYAYNLNKGN